MSYRQAVSRRDERSSSVDDTDAPSDDASDPERPRRLTPPARSGRPPSTGRSKIDDFSEREIRNLLAWLESDGLLRTKLELFDEAREALGFSRRGSRITERLDLAIRDHRANGPVRSNPPAYSTTSSVAGTRKTTSRRRAVSASSTHLTNIRATLSRSVEQGRRVKITYENGRGKNSSRTISIYGLSGSYLDAYDSKVRNQRTFKVSRIKSASMTRQNYVVPVRYRPSYWV